MENDIENIWKNMESKISPKSIAELNELLTKKSKKTVSKFLYIILVDIIVCIGLIIFLIITALNRQGDIIYQLINSVLSLITIVSLIVSLLSWIKLNNNKYNLSLKDWLKERISLLSKWLLGKYSKLYIILIPILLILLNISIHVYFEYKTFMEVVKNEESIYGLTIGFIIGLFVSFFAISKIRKYQLKNLEYLKELYSSIQNPI